MATESSQNEQGPASPGGRGANTNGGKFSAFQWIVGWTVLILLLFLLAKTRIGYLLIYYGLALSVIFLTVTQWRWFAGVLAPFSSFGAFFSTNGGEEQAPSHTETNGGGSDKAPSHSE